MPSTISSSVTPSSSCPQSFPALGSFPMSRLFTSCGQSIGTSVSTWVLLMNSQGWFPLELTGLISLLSKGFSRVFSSTIAKKHQFFGTQLSLWSRSVWHVLFQAEINQKPKDSGRNFGIPPNYLKKKCRYSAAYSWNTGITRFTSKEYGPSLVGETQQGLISESNLCPIVSARPRKYLFTKHLLSISLWVDLLSFEVRNPLLVASILFVFS